MQNFVGKTKCIVGYMKVADCIGTASKSKSNNKTREKLLLLYILAATSVRRLSRHLTAVSVN